MSAAMGETVVLVCADTPMIRQRIKGITEIRNPASDVTLIRLAYGQERIEYRSGGRIFFTAERTFPDYGRGLHYTMLLQDDNL